MSGPNSDQPITLQPHEVDQLLSIYRQHPRDVEGHCGCGVTGCTEGAEARRQLWMGGINPEWHQSSRYSSERGVSELTLAVVVAVLFALSLAFLLAVTP